MHDALKGLLWVLAATAAGVALWLLIAVILAGNSDYPRPVDPSPMTQPASTPILASNEGEGPR